MELSEECLLLLWVIISMFISSGVRKMFSRLEVDVVQIVVGILLCVIEVKVIEDWMVEGNMYRNSKFRYSLGVMNCSSIGFSVRLMSGNSVKVYSSMVMCSFQCVNLVIMVFCESLVLCMKNSRLIMNVVSLLKVLVIWLVQGRKDVVSMMVSSIRVMLLGRKWGWVMVVLLLF